MSSPSLRPQQIGAWELESYFAYKSSDPNDKIYPLDPNACGSIMHTPNGYMSVRLLRPDQPPFATGDGISAATSGTEVEWAEVGGNYIAYTGRFWLDEKGARDGEPLLLHEMRVRNIPRLMGDVQRRVVEITEENGTRYLNLGVRGESLVNGEMRIIKVKWRRMEGNAGLQPPAKL